MAAWEFGAGPMPHWCARVFCLPLVLIGLLWSPRCIWLAFLSGRRARSLHRSNALDTVLAMPRHAARATLTAPVAARGSIADHGRFAELVLEAGVLLLGPIAGVFGIWAILTAS